MPDPGVSLIPRGSKSTKKRRTSFRPASKKSNQSKSKAATASSTKRSKASISKNDEVASTSIADVAASKAPAQANAAETTTNKDDGGASQPLSPRTKSSALKYSSKVGEDETISESEATASKAKRGSKESSSSRTTRASAAAASAATKTTNRKRKAISLNKRISIGSSLRRKTDISNDTSASPTGKDRQNDANSSDNIDSTAIVPASKSKDGEGKENFPKVSTLESKENDLTTAISTGSSNVPAFSAVDQATLNQLASEEKEGKALNAFCTPFKGPKRKLEDNEGMKNSSSSSAKSKVRKENGDAAKGVAANGTADSSAADSNKSNQKVDATTSGAPSVQIIDGQIVLQESSVMLPSRRTVQEVEEEFRDNVVEEDEQLNIVQASYTSFVTKGDHGKTRKKGSWTIEETEKFYFALRQLGTDFGSMEALFFENQRTRKQLKNKYRKELTKNPDLVEELALNPKYQTQLDMTAFNLEVDPKRIEAHENEEPPAYEPTDVEEVEPTTLAEDNDKKPETNENGADYNGVFEREVVEEDAEEERLAEARAQTEANKATTTKKRKRTKPAAKSKKRKNSTSSWSATTKNPKEPEFGEGVASGMDGFPRETEEGPSMDDFFGDSYADDEPMGGDEKGAAKNESSKKKEAPVSSSEAARKKEPSQLVSLVPKKRNAKSRRPKIRPSRRKK